MEPVRSSTIITSNFLGWFDIAIERAAAFIVSTAMTFANVVSAVAPSDTLTALYGVQSTDGARHWNETCVLVRRPSRSGFRAM